MLQSSWKASICERESFGECDWNNSSNHSFHLDFVCVFCPGLFSSGPVKSDLLVHIEGALRRAWAAQTKPNCFQVETHCQSHSNHLDQLPPLQYQWEDRQLLPPGTWNVKLSLDFNIRLKPVSFSWCSSFYGFYFDRSVLINITLSANFYLLSLACTV